MVGQQHREDLAGALHGELIRGDSLQQITQHFRTNRKRVDAEVASVEFALHILREPVGRLFAVAAEFRDLLEVVREVIPLRDDDVGVVVRQAEVRSIAAGGERPEARRVRL